MKAIEFGEERLTDIEGLARELWQDERDPRSSAYVRVLAQTLPRFTGEGFVLGQFCPLFLQRPCWAWPTAWGFLRKPAWFWGRFCWLCMAWPA